MDSRTGFRLRHFPPSAPLPAFSRALPIFLNITALASSSPAAIRPSTNRCSAAIANPRLLPRCGCTTTATVPAAITLTEVERKLFGRLLGTLRHFNLTTQLRVAGAWVRDKLLGKESCDIDIAIDNMLGSEFVDRFGEYLETVGEEVEGVGVIARNPARSNHLETVRMRAFGQWIDVVNFRCEGYYDESRIRTMKFGTAEEDAYRRDLTINSLFYNINKSSVEDLTGRGIADLKSGRIVTPLPPKERFLDDPVRVLRAIRFGARFEFSLGEDLIEAARCKEVKIALAAKGSKERIGAEIDLMICGNQPVKAMSYLSDLTLYFVVFCLPPNAQPDVSERCQRQSIAYLKAAWSMIHSIGYDSFSDQQRRLGLYATLFLPFRQMTDKGTKMPVVNYILRNCLKQKAEDRKSVIKIHQSVDKFAALIPSLTSKVETVPLELYQELQLVDLPTTSKLRVSTGFLLRELRDLWRIALLVSTMLHPFDLASLDEDTEPELDKRKDLFKIVEDAIVELGLDNIWEMQPLLDGREIIDALHLKSDVSEWKQKLFAWQLAHPTGTADECLDWLWKTRSNRSKTPTNAAAS